jgi:hypothetical protein
MLKITHTEKLLSLLTFPYKYFMYDVDGTVALPKDSVTYFKHREKAFESFRSEIDKEMNMSLIELANLNKDDSNAAVVLQTLRKVIVMQRRLARIIFEWKARHGNYIRQYEFTDGETGLIHNPYYKEEKLRLEGKKCENSFINDAELIDVYISVFYDFINYQNKTLTHLTECFLSDTFDKSVAVTELKAMIQQAPTSRIRLPLRMQKNEIAALFIILMDVGFIKGVTITEAAKFIEENVLLYNPDDNKHDPIIDMLVEFGRLSTNTSDDARQKAIKKLLAKLNKAEKQD